MHAFGLMGKKMLSFNIILGGATEIKKILRNFATINNLLFKLKHIKMMMRVKHLFSGMLAVLAVLLLTGCGEKDNPVRTSLDVDTSTLTLSVGESAVRMASSKAEDAAIT